MAPDMDKKNFLSTISLLRLTIYCFLFVAILFGSISYIIVQKTHDWDRLDENIDRVIFLAQKASLKARESQKLKAQYKDSQSHYLQQELEPWILLEKEKKNISRVLHSPGFCGNKPLENRLAFLTSPLNAITLQERPLYTSSSFKEIEVTLHHPVEASLEDVENILKRIEKHEKQKPLLLLSHFHLKRKKPIDHNEVFEINFTILKREF